MEVAILGGLVLLGKKLSDSGKTSRYPHKCQKSSALNQFPGALETSDYDRLAGADRSIFEKNFQKSMNPKETGIISPYYARLDLGHFNKTDPRPFFSSEKAQNTNTDFKQQRMETFTGAIDSCTSATGTYQNKVESQPRFNPTESRQQVTSGGTVGNPVLMENNPNETIWVSGKKNNVRPLTQIRVGPGLNLPTDVDASGGFQQYFRILPKLVNDYKKTSNKGRVVPGKNTVARPQLPQELHKNSRPKVFYNVHSVANPTGGNVHGATANHGTFSIRRGHVGGQEGYQGIGSTVVKAPEAVVSDYTRDKDVKTMTLPMGVASDSREGVGAFVGENIELRRTDRGWNNQPLGGAYANSGTYDRNGHQARVTIRESNENNKFLGQAGTTIDGPTVRVGNQPRTTTREQTMYSYLGGAGTSTLRAPTDNYNIRKNTDRSKTKKDKTLVGFTPGVQVINNFNHDFGTVTGRSDGHTNRSPNLATGVTMTSQYGIGKVTTNQCQTEKNPWDNQEHYNLAKTQWAKNPLTNKVVY